MAALQKKLAFSVYLIYAFFMTQSDLYRLHEKFKALVRLSVALDKAPRTFGTGEALTSAEIHLVEMIGDNGENSSVTDLAKILNITKGAVSQALKRLDKKGFATKDDDPENASRRIVKLTNKGKTAYYAHKHWHDTMDGGFKTYFESLEQEKISFLIEFLTKVEDFYKRAMN